MYGIIHKALKDMVIRDFGEEKWLGIVDNSGVSQDVYLSMQAYDDEITYKLIGSASEVLGAPVDDCLLAFGKYWITVAAPESYGAVLRATGDEIIEFMNNVNALHDRITSTFPKYVPPEFYLEKLGDNLYRITYVSVRAGLASFVEGLLLGLGDRFNCEIDIVSKKQVPADSGEEWKFDIKVR